ncbi:MAG: hypothetical protein VW891_05510, partial [Novosphingobium sp.]
KQFHRCPADAAAAAGKDHLLALESEIHLYAPLSRAESVAAFLKRAAMPSHSPFEQETPQRAW